MEQPAQPKSGVALCMLIGRKAIAWESPVAKADSLHLALPSACTLPWS